MLQGVDHVQADEVYNRLELYLYLQIKQNRTNTTSNTISTITILKITIVTN